jgi:serine/threonine protein kinase
MREGGQDAEQVGQTCDMGSSQTCEMGSSQTAAAQSSPEARLVWVMLALLKVEILLCILIRKRHGQSLAWTQGCTVCPFVWQALRQLHAQGILHGDIRGENVILTFEDGGRRKVTHHGPFRVLVTRLAFKTQSPLGL